MNDQIVATGPLPEWALEQLRQGFQVKVAESSSPESVRALLGTRTVALIARSSTAIDASLMEAAPNLQVIGRTGAGYDSVDVQAAHQRGLTVLYTPEAVVDSTAEHTLALIMAASKDLVGWDQRSRRGDWDQRNRRVNLELGSAVLGILGYGRIGRRVHQLLQPMGATILACDPLLDQRQSDLLGLEVVTMNRLLERSDIVTLHLPLTSETRAIIHQGNINQFKPGAILINGARGGLIESDDLLQQALTAGRLGRVALDVLEAEPPDPDHPLLGNPNALITCHVAARTEATQRRVIETLISDLLALLERRPARKENVVPPGP